MTIRTRGPRGRSIRSAETAELDAEAAELRSQGLSYRQIAAVAEVSATTAYERVQRALAAVPVEAVDELRRVETDRLDLLWRKAMEVLERQHVTISDGRVVNIDGQPILDDEPVLRSIATLLKIQERRSKLLGLDSPVRVDQQVTIHDGDSELDHEIEGLLAKLGPVGKSSPALEAAEQSESTHP